MRGRQRRHIEARHAKLHRRERRHLALGILGALRLEDAHRARTIRVEIQLLDHPGLLELRDPPHLVGDVGGWDRSC
jgi:hypothetical protein